jgi:hypothetical protein
MKNKVDAREKWVKEEPQEKHFDVRDLNFDCDSRDPHFLCSLKYAEE